MGKTYHKNLKELLDLQKAMKFDNRENPRNQIQTVGDLFFNQSSKMVYKELISSPESFLCTIFNTLMNGIKKQQSMCFLLMI